MIKIEFPPYQPKIQTKEGKETIFDVVRKKWVILTPEEWVRQNFIQYLIQTKNISATLISVEKEIKVGELKKRTDIVVYDQQTIPRVIIECKEMNVPLDEKVLQQALRYHITIPVPYIIITNGSYTYCFEKKGHEFIAINFFPVI